MDWVGFPSIEEPVCGSDPHLEGWRAETSGAGLGGNTRETALVSCPCPRIAHDMCLTISVVGGGTMH